CPKEWFAVTVRREWLTVRVRAALTPDAGAPEASLAAGAEVLGRDLVEELAELLHLVLLLVRDGDARVVQHALAAVDRRARAQRQRDGVRRTGADLDSAREDQLGVEHALA